MTFGIPKQCRPGEDAPSPGVNDATSLDENEATTTDSYPPWMNQKTDDVTSALGAIQVLTRQINEDLTAENASDQPKFQEICRSMAAELEWLIASAEGTTKTANENGELGTMEQLSRAIGQFYLASGKMKMEIQKHEALRASASTREETEAHEVEADRLTTKWIGLIDDTLELVEEFTAVLEGEEEDTQTPESKDNIDILKMKQVLKASNQELKAGQKQKTQEEKFIDNSSVAQFAAMEFEETLAEKLARQDLSDFDLNNLPMMADKDIQYWDALVAHGPFRLVRANTNVPASVIIIEKLELNFYSMRTYWSDFKMEVEKFRPDGIEHCGVSGSVVGGHSGRVHSVQNPYRVSAFRVESGQIAASQTSR